jgi:mannose-6-phosphate isomerase-like protein (cupin superfamily)
MDSFEITELIDRNKQAGKPWLEFLRVPALSAGIYRLPAGGDDRQQPHTEDEIYYVLEGRASFKAGDKVTKVQPGAVLFVEARLDHRFFDITEDLTVLVVFGPAEGSRAPQQP